MMWHTKQIIAANVYYKSESMKAIKYITLLLIPAIILSCSKEDEFSTVAAVDIAFVHRDGTAILDGECINPGEQYAVEITTTAEGNGKFKTNEVVGYVINNIVQSIIFTEAGSKIVPAVLVNGINTAQLLESGKESTISNMVQGDFELLE
jgi:hypothetical protein